MPAGVQTRVRSDSAGFQAGVVGVCQNRGADYTITARKDPAVMEAIRGMGAKAWTRYEGGTWEGRETEIAETVHAFGAEDVEASRMVVIRWVKGARDLWEKDPYEYHAVITSLNKWPAGLVLQFHRARQDGSENVNKELSGGFGLSKLPCEREMANAAYFQISLLSAVVFAALKHLVLPKSWQAFTIKTVRFRFIRLAGLVARRSRYLWLKIPEGYRFRSIFEEAWWRIRGLAVELSTG
jgi:hypothetical protein